MAHADVTRREFLTTLAAAGVVPSRVRGRRAGRQNGPDLGAYFALNTQDFAYPDQSRALVSRVLDLHESLAVPVDVYLTTVVHGRTANLGEQRNGLWVRPEHVDLKLFAHAGEDGAAVFDAALAEAPRAEGGRPPYFVGVKMHDNDFFATASAWTTVYPAPGARRSGPPWDTTRRAPLLSEQNQADMWVLYESVVRRAHPLRSHVRLVNARALRDLV